jgi:hypothetical protein
VNVENVENVHYESDIAAYFLAFVKVTQTRGILIIGRFYLS